MFSHVYVVQDGLYTTACFKCSVNPCLSVKSYMKVPTRPFRRQSIPEYVCGDKVYTYDVVLGIDSIIKVPFGEFKTFVILDSMARSVKFWNEDAGLIRVDKFFEAKADTITFELASVNY